MKNNNLKFFKKDSWHVWYDVSIADSIPSLLLNLSGQHMVEPDMIIKNDNLKTIFRHQSNINLIIKHQKYIKLKYLIRANLNKNKKLTVKNEGMLRTEWANNLHLQSKGIPIAKPIAFVEKKTAGIITEQAYIAEEIKTIANIKNYNQSIYNDNFLQQLATLSKKMHSLGIYHLDFHPGNIITNKFGINLIDNESIYQSSKPNTEILALMLGMVITDKKDKVRSEYFWQICKSTINIDEKYKSIFVSSSCKKSRKKIKNKY
ncbi:lipopolysaccharide kinase InaA family protein [Ferrimonas lipolytica]|uniref:Lipopolysaccharide kinase (Kdo/WaaP) family protein n=1 Tax=Ferrimonas lipolytica TaxID=2724191 RepID=A0A6H1UGX6_9GAMM|nr:lipopolysaccharide kinase InaA family protein [Ferrimonas lipolytica]QIZ78357.1 hypothetical protein HER31_16495 [Ferrimonas lipolytica]